MKNKCAKSDIVKLYIALSRKYEKEGDIYKAIECLLKAKEEDVPGNHSFYEENAHRLLNHLDYDSLEDTQELDLQDLELSSRNKEITDILAEYLPHLSEYVRYSVYPDICQDMMEEAEDFIVKVTGISAVVLHETLQKETILAVCNIEAPYCADLFYSVKLIFTDQRMIGDFRFFDIHLSMDAFDKRETIHDISVAYDEPVKAYLEKFDEHFYNLCFDNITDGSAGCSFVFDERITNKDQFLALARKLIHPIEEKNAQILQTLNKYLPKLSPFMQYTIYPDYDDELINEIQKVFQEDTPESVQIIQNIIHQEPVLATVMIQNPKFEDLIMNDTSFPFIFTTKRIIMGIDHFDWDGDVWEYNHITAETVSIRYDAPVKDIIQSKDVLIFDYPEGSPVCTSYFYGDLKIIDMNVLTQIVKELLNKPE